MTSPVLERIARGDRAAVPECLDRYGGLVWALARRHAADPADAEDAVQEVFIDLWRSAWRFDASAGTEATFVATIARRRLIDRQRRRSRRPTPEPLPEGGPACPNTADRIDLDDEARAARARLADLSPDQRRVLERAIDGGRTQAEIAEELGMPLGTVKAHARRGLIRLRELLGGDR